MIPNWNKILKEWSYRVGVIKPNNVKHLEDLKDILIEEGWSYEVTNEFIENLNEIDFKNQDAFDAYNKKHKMRKTTKVTIGDKETTVGDAETGGEKDKEEIIKQTKEKNKELWDKIEKEESPKRKEALKAEYINTQLDNMLRVSSIERGAGRYNMSREDVQSYRKYLEKIMADPENEPKKSIDKIKEERKRKYGEITEDDIDKFIEGLEGSSKAGSGKSDKYDPEVVTSIKAKVRGKGAPGSSYTSGDAGAERYRNVIRAYLETGGISPITGEVVPFSECQLDHIVSLGNEGQDEPDNWMFMEERFNQFKGKKTDENVRADVEESYWRTEAEIEAGIENSATKKQLKGTF